jgi:hypothetical protein
MTRATKIKKARKQAEAAKPEPPRIPRGLLLLAVAGVVGLLVAGALLWGSSSGGQEEVFTGVPFTDPGPIHVHGLGINPADGSLIIATHTGLFRVGKDSRKAVRIADRFQDTMGFSVVGPDRFLGSGHPDAREQNLPPFLGLIESTNGGDSWEPISLLGDADFHVLRSQGKYVYGYDASNDRLLRSTNAGRSWQEFNKPGKRLDTPAQVVDFAIDPQDSRRLVMTAIGGLDQGMYESRNAGASWKRLNYAAGLLAWPAPKRLYLVDGNGEVTFSSSGGAKLEQRGKIGGQPAALLGQGADELYVALHDGTIKRSQDGGITWEVRSTP